MGSGAAPTFISVRLFSFAENCSNSERQMRSSTESSWFPVTFKSVNDFCAWNIVHPVVVKGEDDVKGETF